jgi:chromosome segregation ATPase
MSLNLAEIQQTDAEMALLSTNIERLVDNIQILQEENRNLKNKITSLTKQLNKLYSDLDEAEATTAQIQSEHAEADEVETKPDVFAPLILSFEEKLVIRQRLEHILEQVNLELQRLS